MSKREGWDVFKTDGNRLEIQREDEEAAFPDDLAALRHVIACAAEGDLDAERALYAVNFQDHEGWTDWNSNQ
jgi:hypothetical protein